MLAFGLVKQLLAYKSLHNELYVYFILLSCLLSLKFLELSLIVLCYFV